MRSNSKSWFQFEEDNQMIPSITVCLKIPRDSKNEIDKGQGSHKCCSQIVLLNLYPLQQLTTKCGHPYAANIIKSNLIKEEQHAH